MSVAVVTASSSSPGPLHLLDFLLQNQELWLLLIGAGGWLLKKVMTKPEIPPAPRGRAVSQQDEDAERTRRVQEEVRRRIAERRLGRPVPPAIGSNLPVPSEIEAPRPVAPSWSVRRRPAVAEEPSEPVQNDAPASPVAAVAARRAEPLAPLMAGPEAAFAPPVHKWTAQAARPTKGSEIAGELKDPEAVRRAFVLREILGRPLALR